MKWSLRLAFGLAAVLGLVLVSQALTQDNPAPRQGVVQIDLNKLSPELAKRLLDEVAKQKAAAPAQGEPEGDKGKAAVNREKGGEAKGKMPARRKGGERPTSGRPAPAGKAPEKEAEKKEAEKR